MVPLCHLIPHACYRREVKSQVEECHTPVLYSVQSGDVKHGSSVPPNTACMLQAGSQESSRGVSYTCIVQRSGSSKHKPKPCTYSPEHLLSSGVDVCNFDPSVDPTTGKFFTFWQQFNSTDLCSHCTDTTCTFHLHA